MSQLMVRYKVKAGEAARNEELVRQVYAELKQSAPPDLRYATFVLDDGVSYVHIASGEGDAALNTLQELAAFRTYSAEVNDRCAEQPAQTGLREIDSYHFWGD